MSKESDYLFKMFQKYAPSKKLYGYECFTKESAKWFDNIIFVKLKTNAFEIIKKKRVDVNDLLDFASLKHYNQYVTACDDNKKRRLTKEEWDLLRKMLKDEK